VQERVAAKRIDIIKRFSDVLTHVTFPGITFHVLWKSKSNYFYLQIKFEAACNITGNTEVWKGRKWLLSQHMTDSELVQTAFKAVLTAMEHETREKFKFMGQSIFDPHYDVNLLVELRQRSDALSTRANEKGGE
jgi:hypothetical protein